MAEFTMIMQGRDRKNMQRVLWQISAMGEVCHVILAPSLQSGEWSRNQKLSVQLYEGISIPVEEAQDLLISGESGYCLAGSAYVLLETSENTNINSVSDIFYDLLLHNFIPILSNPEYGAFQTQSPQRLLKWMQKGALVQCDACSLSGIYGKDAREYVNILLQHYMTCFWAVHVDRVDENMDLPGVIQNLYDWAEPDYIRQTLYEYPACILSKDIFYPDIPEYIAHVQSGILSRLGRLFK